MTGCHNIMSKRIFHKLCEGGDSMPSQTFLNLDVKKSVKALLMNANGELVILFVRGDRELCENKVCKLLGINELNFADDALIATSNAIPGYTGPIGLNAKVVVDNEVLKMIEET